MSTYEVHSVEELSRLLTKHLEQREKKVHAAIRRAAGKGRAVIKKNVPVAFGEIRETVHTEGETIVVDAPHAAAANNGSRPHWMPLGPLIEWVKLRGMQGLQSERQQSRLPGTTTRAQARGVAASLAAIQVGSSLSVSAPEQVARAIQHAIAMKGTKPHHFIEKSLPEIAAILDAELREAMGGEPDAGGAGTPAAGGGAAATGPKTTSGAYRKHTDSFRGSRIQTDAGGRRFADLKNGKRVFLRN